MSVLIGICGGSGSGKTTLAGRLVDRIGRAQQPGTATVLSFDSYYHNLLHLSVDERAAVNFDHPDSLDGDLLVEHLRQLKAGNDIAMPVYDFTTHTRSSEIRIVAAADVVVIEGILLFAFDEVRRHLDYRVFRRCPESVRFERRIERDVAERGRSIESVRSQLAATVKPMHDRFVEPYGDTADFVTDHGQDLDAVVTELVERLTDPASSPAAG